MFKNTQTSNHADFNIKCLYNNNNNKPMQTGDNSSQDTKNPVATVPVDVDTPMVPDVIVAEDLQQPQAVEIITERIKIPRLSSRDLARPKRQHSPCKESPVQFGFLFNGHGIKNDPTKIISSSTTKIRLLELDECVKRAKKYALEQSVRYVLVKQQQQQQKQQLELIKKQQALLLMCRYVWDSSGRDMSLIEIVRNLTIFLKHAEESTLEVFSTKSKKTPCAWHSPRSGPYVR
jgi:hypothetical protein